MGMMGALIGAAIDRRDGDSGIKGAVLGAALQRGMRVAVPVAGALWLGSVLKRRMARSRQASRGAGPA